MLALLWRLTVLLVLVAKYQLSVALGRREVQLDPAALFTAMATNSSGESEESTFARRKRQRVENYSSGCARSAYRFQRSLQEGLAASSSTPERSCKRHCSVALEGLKPAFLAISKHPAKVLQKRMASYPTPKKEKLAHQNYRGTIKSQ
jgi:hypothetical protein